MLLELLEVMREVRNYFPIVAEIGVFKIEDGILTGFKNPYPVGAHLLIERARTNGQWLKTMSDEFLGLFDSEDRQIFDDLLRALVVAESSGADGRMIYNLGSFLNPGVYDVVDETITLDGVRNETWQGIIYSLAVPPDFMKLVGQIADFQTSSEATPTNIISERFDKQTYTRAVDKATGQVATWQAVFKRPLGRFRRMFTEVHV